MEKNPEAAKTFTPLAVQNFRTTDPSVLKIIMEKNPEAAKTFTLLRYKTLEQQTLCYFIIMNNNPTATEHFATLQKP